jgi:3-oxoadipate enol-lactonase
VIPLDEHVLPRPDATIRYWTAGPADAPIVVLLHGATLDHQAWAPQIEALAARFFVVAPDLRAHGASTGHFEFHAAVEDILALLDELPSRRIVLVGLSLGGNIAQEVLRRRPDDVRALVAADTTCNTAARHPLAASLSVATVRAQALMAGEGFAQQAARATAANPEARDYVLQVNADRSNRETVHILTSLLTTALHSDPDYRLPVPTLLVHGQHDHIGDIATAMPSWAQREPLARHAVIANAGHVSNLDNPEAFTALLTTFLDEVLRPTESSDAFAERAAEELYQRYGSRP